MADIVDMAQAYEALERAAALANRDHRIGPGAFMINGVAICWCGEPIPRPGSSPSPAATAAATARKRPSIYKG